MSNIERLRVMERALREIEQWSRAYPVTVFREPTEDDFQKAAQTLKAAGLTLDSITASIMRDTLEGVGRIAREALAKAGST